MLLFSVRICVRQLWLFLRLFSTHKLWWQFYGEFSVATNTIIIFVALLNTFNICFTSLMWLYKPLIWYSILHNRLSISTIIIVFVHLLLVEQEIHLLFVNLCRFDILFIAIQLCLLFSSFTANIKQHKQHGIFSAVICISMWIWFGFCCWCRRRCCRWLSVFFMHWQT